MKKLFFLYTIFLFSSTVTGEVIEQTFRFGEDECTFSRLNEYDLVELQGASFTIDPGKPMLPLKFYRILLPPDATLDRVEIISKKEIKLPGKYTVYPVQPCCIVSTNEEPPFVEPNPEVYGSTSPYPEEVVSHYFTGTLTGFRIGSFSIAPFSYIPASGELTFIKEIKVRIYYTSNTWEVIPRQINSVNIVKELIERIVINPKSISILAPPTSQNFCSSKVLPPDTVEYVVITSQALAPYFTPLIKWKTKKGVPAKVVTLNWIYANYSGVDNPEKIRNFIHDAHTTWGTMWILLGGQCDYENSQEIVPRRDVFYGRLGVNEFRDEDTIPCDLYYSDLDGTWNANRNSVWGELPDSVDFYSDVYVGRAPVLNRTHVELFVNKTLTYEKNPPRGYLTRLFLPAARLFWRNDGTSIQEAITRITPTGWTITKLYEIQGELSLNATVNVVNSGIGFAHLVAHGWMNGVYYGNDQAFLYSGAVDNLTNRDKLGIFNAISCLCGAVDLADGYGGDCFAEHFLTATNGGAVATIMNTRHGIASTDGQFITGGPALDTSFYNEVFIQKVKNLGTAHAFSKDNFVQFVDRYDTYPLSNIYPWSIYVLNLFGDPELPLWTQEPTSLQVTHDREIMDGIQDFSVTVKNSNRSPIRDAKVCVMSQNVYSVGKTNASGQVNLQISPSAPDTLWVTVTAYSFLPYEGHALVKAAGIAYLKYTIIDTIAPGNRDGRLNPGEIVNIDVWIKNRKGSVASNVMSRLVINDPLVDVLTDWGNYGNISANDSSCASFQIGVSEYALDGHGVFCNLVVYEGGNKWRISFSIPVVGIQKIQVNPQFLSFYYKARKDKGDVDTIKYDTGNPSTSKSYEYVGVRFTPQSMCSLKAVLMYGKNENSQRQDTVFVFDDDNGKPGTLIEKILFQVPTEQWHYFPLTTGYADENDFWICVYMSSWFSCIYGDEEGNHPRSFESGDGNNWTQITSYDLLIRAVVKYYTPATGVGELWAKSTGGIGATVDSVWAKNSSEWISFLQPRTRFEIPPNDSCKISVGIDTAGLSPNVQYWDTILISSSSTPSPSVTSIPIRVWISTQANTSPVVSGIPDQSLSSGISVKIELDQYVQEVEDPLYMLSWSYKIIGEADSLRVNISSSRVATIKAISPWAGERNIIFKVEDTQGLSDEDTIKVTVTVPGAEEKVSHFVYKVSLTPNPCRGHLIINYQLPVADKVEFNIYDISGKLVNSFIRTVGAPGPHRVAWSARQRGIYFLRMQSGSFTKTIKFVVI